MYLAPPPVAVEEMGYEGADGDGTYGGGAEAVDEPMDDDDDGGVFLGDEGGDAYDQVDYSYFAPAEEGKA